MNWNILGIQPTKDKKAITAAYRAKLLQVNPEDKPEEFKALRAAYEEALRLADKEEPEVHSAHDPLSNFQAQLREVYDDFSRRIDPDCWLALLSQDICQALDTRPQAEDAILRFLMEDYFIPQSIWQVLDRSFHLSQRKDELYESYPRDFIDHAVLNGIRMKPTLPYELFTPGKDGKACDALRQLYYQTGSCAPEERPALLAQMAALPEQHPYCDALVFLDQIDQGGQDQGMEGLRTLAQRYPDDVTLNMAWINRCPGQWELAEETARRLLETEPKNRQVRLLLADCLAHREEYDEAKDIIFDLIHDMGGDQVQINRLQDKLKFWNESIIAKGEPMLSADPSDSHTARTLAWCYLQNDDLDNAARVSACVDPGQETAFDYHNLMGKIAFAREDAAAALPHFERIVALLQEIEDQPEHPDFKNVHRLPDFLQITGSCLINLERQAEAAALFERALALAPEDPVVLDHTGRLYYLQKDYEAAAGIYARLNDVLPRNYHGYLMLALNLYELGRDRDAFDAINRALDLEGSDLTVYVTKMRILLRNGVWDQVRQMLEFLERSGVGDEITVCWCRAVLTEYADKDYAKALEQYRHIETRRNNGEVLPWGAELYYRITVLTANHLDARKPEDRKAMIGLLDQALECDPDHEDSLDYKAWLLKRGGSKDEAMKIYRQLEAKPRHSLNAELGIAQIYYDDLSANADKALEYYELLLRHQERADYHFYAGTCLRYLGKQEEAADHFRREQELEPEDVDAFNGLAYTCEAMGQYSLALEALDCAIAVCQKKEKHYSWLFEHKAQVLRRMGRAQEAIDTLSEAINIYNQPKCHSARFETCCQFGLWDQAKTVLNHWIKTQCNTEENAEAAVMLQLYQGKMVKATMAFASGVKHIGDYRQDEIKMNVANLEGNPQRGLRVWGKRYLDESEHTRTVGSLALYQWLNGERDAARETAEKLLELLDRKLSGFTVDEALYRTQRTRGLAILGRFDEARSELEKARSLPLCSHCVYGSCKDADVFEAELEEIAGNTQKALEYYRAAAAKWPDELDLAAGIARLTKKGKK